MVFIRHSIIISIFKKKKTNKILLQKHLQKETMLWWIQSAQNVNFQIKANSNKYCTIKAHKHQRGDELVYQKDARRKNDWDGLRVARNDFYWIFYLPSVTCLHRHGEIICTNVTKPFHFRFYFVPLITDMKRWRFVVTPAKCGFVNW